MSNSRLVELTYFDPQISTRLQVYADTIILDRTASGGVITAVRFGGYPEEVRAMSDAIYAGATIEASLNGSTVHLEGIVLGYRRQLAHDGIYATATLMADDDPRSIQSADEDGAAQPAEENARKCYIFSPAGDSDRLFEELDRKTAAPLISAFRDYVLQALIDRGDLLKLQVYSLHERMDAWVLSLRPEDQNVVEVLEQGLKTGAIAIPGAAPGSDDGFVSVDSVTGYLNTFGVTVANRIRNQFNPLFDPASEPLSEGILEVNR